jgi:hypothetical protein
VAIAADSDQETEKEISMLKPLVASALVALTALPVLAQPKPQTVSEQVALRGLPVYSSEGRQIGQVTQVRIASDGQVGSVRAELTNGSGPEAKIIEIPVAQFTQKPDRIVLSVTGDEADKLPAVQ